MSEFTVEPATALTLLLKRLREPMKYSQDDLGKFCVDMRDALMIEIFELDETRKP